MRIAYVTTYDSSDVRAWSGIGLTMRSALVDAGVVVDPVGPLSGRNRIRTGATKLYNLSRGRQHHADRDPRVIASYGRAVAQSAAVSQADLIFSPGTIPVAQLETKKPIVVWTDATFDGLVGFYPEYSRLSRATLTNGRRMEQEALSRSSLVIYSSEWAANTALRHYEIDPQKVRVVPFGANLSPTSDDSYDAVGARHLDNGTIRLLWVGVDWRRKGGDVALEVAEILNSRGIAATLDIVGCAPPDRLPWFASQHGFLSKNVPSDRISLDRLFARATFLLLPSRAECCAVVLAEAAAYGLPSLASDVGGNRTAVLPGVNGQVFAVPSDPAEYATFVERNVSPYSAYLKMRHASRRLYLSHLNWSVAAQSVRVMLEELITK